MRFEFDVFIMRYIILLIISNSVSEDLLCAFELLKPLDGAALRKEMTKAKRKRCVSIVGYVGPLRRI